MQVIGIGAGDPDHLTFQAAAAIARTDVFFTIDKGDQKADLAALRAVLLARHARPGHRVVVAPDPERDRAASPDAYEGAVVEWQDRRGALYQAMITDALPDGGTGAFLVWGDPSLYDGTLRILGELDGLTIVSIPGISSVSALAAAHRLILHRVGRPFTVTTGRRLRHDGLTGDDVVVLLDARCAFADLPDTDVDIYWGAYLGTPDELLVAGALPEVAPEIRRVREAARARKGWIMDTYLLRRRSPR